MSWAIVSRDLLLARGEVMHIDAPRSVEVSVASGRVWITEESRPDDIWIAAGERVRLQGPGRAVIEAIDTACVHVERT